MDREMERKKGEEMGHSFSHLDGMIELIGLEMLVPLVFEFGCAHIGFTTEDCVLVWVVDPEKKFWKLHVLCLIFHKFHDFWKLIKIIATFAKILLVVLPTADLED